MRTAILAFVLVGLAATTAEAQLGRLNKPDPYQAEYRAIQEKLRQRRISLDFTDAPLADVLQFMRQVLSINILVDPNIYQDRSPEELKVTMSVKDLRADNALNLLLSFNNLVKTYRNGVMLITTKDRHTEDVFLVVYDVRDMMFTVRDFKGPNISLTSSGGGSTGPGAVFDMGDDESSNALSNPDTILEIVQNNAVASSWEENDKCTISIINGLLVVNQTRSGHYEVLRLLNMLRSFR